MNLLSSTELWWFKRSCLFFTCGLTGRERISNEGHVCNDNPIRYSIHSLYTGKCSTVSTLTIHTDTCRLGQAV